MYTVKVPDGLSHCHTPGGSLAFKFFPLRSLAGVPRADDACRPSQGARGLQGRAGGLPSCCKMVVEYRGIPYSQASETKLTCSEGVGILAL